MKVNVDPEWSLEETFYEARQAYIGGGITSKGYRNSVLLVWANMAGKKRALAELNSVIKKYGSKDNAARALGMSLSTFNSFIRSIRSFPDPPPTRQPNLFLIHAQEDKPIVTQLDVKLTQAGYQVWFDKKSLLGGQDWNLEIQKAIREVDIVIVCLSSNAWDKQGYIQKEIRLALDMADYRPEGKAFIIPIRLDDCLVPTRLQQWQYVNYFEPDGYSKLLLSLEAQAVPI